MKLCISCGMPLETTLVSKFNQDFCVYCQDQASGKIKTYEEVREGTIGAAMRLMDKTEEEATTMADTLLPNLPYWKK